jgi:arginyl-tRNA synthetase
MIKFKERIAQMVEEQIKEITQISLLELMEYIEVPKNLANGDYAFPCFRLAKVLKKSPAQIAQDLANTMKMDEEVIEKIEVAGGYINFFIKKEILTKEVIQEFVQGKENYGKSELGKGKKIVIDYSAPNIAKPFHIGHLRSTVIGGALYRIYQYLGYQITGVNHLGDYGTQFGKLIEGYLRWGEEYNLDQDPIGELTKIYIRINELCKQDENALQACRDNFKKLEDGDETCIALWERFRALSLQEFQKVYDVLGSKFDSWNGEAFYSDKMPEVITLLEKSGRLIESQGAKIIDLETEGINTPCIIQKSNGSSTYATRDLAAILYRARTYDFDKALYVTSYEQVLHFKQVFAVAKLLGIDEKYTKGLEHVSFGMVLLPTGKMSTREGTSIRLEELLQEAVNRAKIIIEQKNPNLENKEEVAKKVGVGAVIFNDLSNSRIKDEIFDWDQILNFQGETGPYIQYTYVRTKSILEKVEPLPEGIEIDVTLLEDEHSQMLLKIIYGFQDTLIQVTEKNEPSILSRYLLDLAKAFSSFYQENRIVGEKQNLQEARAYLTNLVGQVLKIGAGLLGMEMPEKM